MEIESDGNNDNDGVVYQSDTIQYKEAYTMNGFQVYDMFTIADMIALIFDGLIRQTDKIEDSDITVFHARSVPTIQIKDYLHRIIIYSKCSSECLLLSLIYIDRLIERNQGFLLKSLNIHRYNCFLLT